mgnify:CR=1 FL=1
MSYNTRYNLQIMNLIKYCLIVVICFTIMSCESGDYIDSKDTTKFLQFNNILIDSVKLSDLFDSYELIPLRMSSSNEAVFGKISKLIAWDDRIIILDSEFTNNIFAYDSLGNFVYKLNIGKGRGEVINTEDFCVVNDQLYVLDNGDKSIKIFGLDDGIFIRRIPLGHYFRGIGNLNGNLLVLSNSATNAWEIFNNNSCVIYNMKTEKIIPFHKPIRYLPYQEFIGTSSPFTSVNGNVFFASSFTNSIYEIEDIGKYSKIEINFGHDGLHNHYNEIRAFQDLNKFSNNTSYISGMVASSMDRVVYTIRNHTGTLQHLFLYTEDSSNEAYSIIINDLYSLPILYFKGHSNSKAMYTELDINMLSYYIDNSENLDHTILDSLSNLDFSTTNSILVKLIYSD